MPATPALILIGDECDWDSFKKLRRFLQAYSANNFDHYALTYDQLEQQLPLIPNQTIIFFPFFPFNYWDKHIEFKSHSGIYGSEDFYAKFKKFWVNLYQLLCDLYHNRTIFFINHPLKISICRDKELAKSILEKNNIPTPPSIFTRQIEEILAMIQQGKRLYLKVRYGSMGKGFTRLQKDKWETNFRFTDGKIHGPITDHGWTFIDITGNLDFLKELLIKDIVIEEDIDSILIEEQKFDLRVYTFLNKVLYLYARTAEPNAVTTNISQGAKGRPPSFLVSLPRKTIKNIQKLALQSTQALGLNFAGVDIMINKKGQPFVIELNAFAGFPPTINPDPELNFPLSQKIVQVFEKEIAKKRYAL